MFWNYCLQEMKEPECEKLYREVGSGSIAKYFYKGINAVWGNNEASEGCAAGSTSMKRAVRESRESWSTRSSNGWATERAIGILEALDKLRTGWVEVVGVSGRSLAECTPIVGDQHWTRVTWKGADNLGVGDGKPVTLRVEMKQAKIFGLRSIEPGINLPLPWQTGRKQR